MNITVKAFGATATGEPAYLYTLENNNGMSVTISNYGGIITNIMVPDKNGAFADVVLAHPSIEDYHQNIGCFGAIVGRNANRIKGACIELDNITYELEQNNGANNLHSGSHGLQYHLFDAEAITNYDTTILHLVGTLFDLEDGFPGNLEVEVDYTLTDDNALIIEYHAVSDQTTVINLTNHSYFNLAGHNAGNLNSHTLEMDATFYSPNDTESLPTGEVLSVAGTPMDFTTEAPIGKAIADFSYEQVERFHGIDHNYMLNGSDYRPVVILKEETSGRTMTVATDLPAVHLYTGNALPAEGMQGKAGATYKTHQGICFETQTVPNATQTPWLASPIYQGGEEYFATTTFQFGIEE